MRAAVISTTRASRSLAARATRTAQTAQTAQTALAGQAERAGPVVAPRAAERRIAHRLDEFMQKMGGPYQVAGQRVQVPAAFRMVGGMGQRAPQVYSARIARALGTEQFRKLVPTLGSVVSGKGSPEAVRRLTQALIDSPAFDKYAALPPVQAVRRLMWDFGIGMDCSGYVHRAFLYSRGSEPDTSAPASRYALGSPLASAIQRLPNGVFSRVSPAAARAGDIMVLTNGPDGTGHKLIVHDRDRLAPGSALHRTVERGLGSSPTARIHLFRVDSSWGAGGVPEQGGVKRETWAYDEGSGKWATLVQGESGSWYAVASGKSGPYDHDLAGIFRPGTEQ